MRADHEEVEFVLRVLGDGFAREARELFRLHGNVRLFKALENRRDGLFKLLGRALFEFLRRDGRHHVFDARRRHQGLVVAHDVKHAKVRIGAEEVLVREHVVGCSFAVGRTVDRDPDAQAIPRLGHFVAKEQKRTLRFGEDRVRNGAEKETLPKRLAARTHDDQVGIEILGLFGDHLAGLAAADDLLRLKARGADFPAKRLEDPLPFGAVIGFERLEREHLHETLRNDVLHGEQFDLGVLSEHRFAPRQKAHGGAAARTAVDGHENSHGHDFLLWSGCGSGNFRRPGQNAKALRLDFIVARRSDAFEEKSFLLPDLRFRSGTPI